MSSFLRHHATAVGIILGASVGVLTMVGMHSVSDMRDQQQVTHQQVRHLDKDKAKTKVYTRSAASYSVHSW